MNFVDKYRPQKLEDIKGQDLAVSRIKEFVDKFPNKRKACILYGPAGCGKTASAYAIAKERNAEIIELNASDFRDKKKISEIVGGASSQKSLFASTKILLIDEVDGISGFYDRGGLLELVRLIDLSSFPIIMTANHIWDKKFSDLRRLGELIEFKELSYKSLYELLKEISVKEKLDFSEDLLKAIAINAKGDVRAALNDLQTVGKEGIELGERDREENIFNVLKQVFKDLPSNHVISLYDKLNMPIDEISLWLEENIPKEYTGVDLVKAINLLSKADLFKGRIYRQQHWRFLLYQNFFLSFGVSASKSKINKSFTSYKRPDRILKIWMINQKYQKKKEIARKYSSYCHVSFKRAMADFPIIQNFLKNPEVQKELNLTSEEVRFLKN